MKTVTTRLWIVIIVTLMLECQVNGQSLTTTSVTSGVQTFAPRPRAKNILSPDAIAIISACGVFSLIGVMSLVFGLIYRRIGTQGMADASGKLMGTTVNGTLYNGMSFQSTRELVGSTSSPSCASLPSDVQLNAWVQKAEYQPGIRSAKYSLESNA